MPAQQRGGRQLRRAANGRGTITTPTVGNTRVATSSLGLAPYPPVAARISVRAEATQGHPAPVRRATTEGRRRDRRRDDGSHPLRACERFCRRRGRVIGDHEWRLAGAFVTFDLDSFRVAGGGPLATVTSRPGGRPRADPSRHAGGALEDARPSCGQPAFREQPAVLWRV
jgi:hypothetical protein